MNLVVKETKVICSNPDNPYHGYFAWPTVTRLRDGKLAMVASGFRTRHICPFGKVVMCTSEDEGKTWSRPTVVMDTPLDDRDGGILPFGESGVLITSFNNTIEGQRNNLLKRNDPLNNRYVSGYLDLVDAQSAEERYFGSTIRFSNDNGRTFGPIMRVPITSPHGPTLLPDGTILYVGTMFSNEAYVAAYKLNLDGSCEKLGSIENIAPNLISCEPHAVVLDSGKIIVHIRVQGDGILTTYQSESTDGGKTFTKPHPLLSSQGGAPAHLLQLKNGTLISTYGYRQEPYGVKMMYSTDGGEQWSTDHTLFAEGVSWDLGYPASVELENGDILTVFYAREQVDAPAVIMQTIWSF